MAAWQGQLVLRFSLFVCPSACQSCAALAEALTSLRLRLSKLSGMCHEHPASRRRGVMLQVHDEARAPSSVLGVVHYDHAFSASGP